MVTATIGENAHPHSREFALYLTESKLAPFHYASDKQNVIQIFSKISILENSFLEFDNRPDIEAKVNRMAERSDAALGLLL